MLLSRRLEERGFDTLLAAGEPDPREGDLRGHAVAEGLSQAPVAGLVRRISPGGDARALPQILRLIRRWRPDVVHTHMMKAGLLGRLAAFACRVPVRVHTFHGHVFSGYFPGGLSRLLVVMESSLARLTDRLVAVGPTVRSEICERYGIAPPRKVVTIRLGVPGMARAPRRDGPPALGFAGRLVKVKDPALFVAAAAGIRRELPNLIIRIAGDGPLREAVREQALQQGPGGAVEMLGWSLEMGSFYGGIDLLMLTSRNEGTPRSILEAQAAGIPVVATDVGGVRDLFTPRREEGDLRICDEGIIVGRRDPGLLAAAAKMLLLDRGLRNRMGEAGRRKVERDHGEDRLVDETEALYRDLLEAKGLTGRR